MGLSRKLSKRRCLKCTVVYILTWCMLFNTSLPVVLAGPEGAQIINGQVSFQQSGYNTTITASDKSIINYSSFDIARPEIVEFIQPSSNASVLNRILSANPTNINGTLLANGRIFFVNPAGVYIGAGARVNVNQLVASGLNITNSDFINGQYNFAGGNGSVVNDGDISANEVYLIGKQVTNSGNISCPDGYVVMASGDRVFLGEPGTDVVLEVDKPSAPESAEPLDGSGVLNEGNVDVAGGTVVLAAGDIYSQAISNTGTLSASIETGNAGQITLTADGGEITNTGTIEAIGSKGGQVVMEGARVGQFGAINVDGIDSDGGNVDLRAEDVVALSSDSLTTANAGTNGDGGDIIIYSPDTALFRDGAKIEVKGGIESGNGGFVEVSGKEHVEVYGIADRTAVNGESGMLLIDPANISITDNGVDHTTWTGDDFAPTNPAGAPSQIDIDTLEAHLDSGDTTITTTWDDQGNPTTNPDPGEAGNVTFNAARDLKDGVAGGSNNSLTINADGSIIFMANSGINFTGTGDVTLNVGSNGSVDLNANISTAGALSSNATTVNVQSNNAQIQDAIAIADDSSITPTINVSNGTYTEDLTIDKSLILNGEQADTPVPGSSRNHTDDTSESIIKGSHTITSGTSDVTINGFTFSDPDPSTTSYNSLVQLDSSNGKIDTIMLQNNFFIMGSGDIGVDFGGYSLSNQMITNVIIEDSAFLGPVDMISNPMRIGANYGTDFDVPIGDPLPHDVAGVTFQRNTVDSGSIPIQLEGEDLHRITITQNTFTNTDGTVYIWSNADPSNPIELSYFEYSYNDVDSTNSYGVGIGVGNNLDNDDLDTSTISITNNSFDNVPGKYGIGAVSVVSSGFTDTINATENWWGDVSGPADTSDDTATGGFYNPAGLGSGVSDHVDYSPWLGLGDADLVTVGFQMASPMTWGMIPSVSSTDFDEWIGLASADDTLELRYSTDATIPAIDDGGLGVNLNITSNGVLTIGGKVTVGGDVMFGGIGPDGSTGLIVDGDIDPVSIHLSSNDDVTINSALQADDWILVEAGLDGTGNVTIDYTGTNTGSLQTTAVGGDITVTAGTTDGTSGNISLNGTATITTSGATGDGHVITLTSHNTMTMADGSLIDAGDGLVNMDSWGTVTLGGILTTSNAANAITITTNADVVDGGDSQIDMVTGSTGTMIITTETGIGTAADAIETSTGILDAHSNTSGDIVIVESDDITLSNVDTAAGNIDVTAGGAINATSVIATDGSVSLDAGGLLTATDVQANDSAATGDYDILLTTSTGGIDLQSVTADDDLIATAAIGNIIDSGIVTVGGTASFTTSNTDDDINLGKLDVAGSISLSTIGSTGNATIVNTSTVDLAASTVGGSLDVTATDGAIIDSGAVAVTGPASFTANGAGGGITLDSLEADSTVALDTGGNALVTNDTALDLAASTVDGSLDVTATDGVIIDSGAVAVTGPASFTANGAGGGITLDSLEADSTVALDTGGNALVTNDTALYLAASTVGGTLDATATTGDLSVNGAVSADDGYDITSSLGDVIFTANGSVTGAATSSIDATTGSIANTGSDEAKTIETTGAGSNLTLTAANDLTQSTKAMTVLSGGNLIVNAPLDNTSSTTNLSSADNLAINANLTDATAISAHAGTDGTGNITFGTGVTLDAPVVTLQAGDGSGPGITAEVDLMNNTPTVVTNSLIIEQDGDLGTKDDPMTVPNEDDPWNPNVNNNATIDLNLKSYDSSIYTTDADSWKSITATADSGITLEGTGNITSNSLTSRNGNILIYSALGDLIINNSLTSNNGGVSLISDFGKIYTNDGTGKLNVAITGYSDTGGAGVELPVDPTKKGAIVVVSEDNLNLGSGATLTANGTYDPQVVDDREGVYFIPDGDPIDVAINLRSNGGNIRLESQVSIPSRGTMAIVALNKVEDFGPEFVLSLSNNTLDRLEVGSLKAQDLQMAIVLGLLPHADEPSNIANGAFIHGGGTYVLRGLAGTLGLAVLDLTAPVPLVVPMPLEPEMQGEVEEPDMEAIAQLLDELGIGVQPFLARAYQPSLNTDLNLLKAAEKLLKLATILEDADGSRITALVPLIRGISDSPIPLEEQMTSFIQELSRHELAGQWVNALTEYADILNSEIGLPTEDSVARVMVRYGGKLTGPAENLFVEEYLAQTFAE